MSVQAYVLIETKPAMGENVRAAINRASMAAKVKRVKAITGPYDVIAEIEADDINVLSQSVTETIHKIDGVVHTITSVIVHLERGVAVV